MGLQKQFLERGLTPGQLLDLLDLEASVLAERPFGPHWGHSLQSWEVNQHSDESLDVHLGQPLQSWEVEPAEYSTQHMAEAFDLVERAEYVSQHEAEIFDQNVGLTLQSWEVETVAQQIQHTVESFDPR